MVHTVVMARHGESEWNKENLFTGMDSKITRYFDARTGCTGTCCNSDLKWQLS